MCAGASLRLWQYFANSSLWIDEAALARNIIERALPELFAPLHYAQVAPVGFLAIQKAVITVFGTGELALRLFPLISGLAALFLFHAVARRMLEGWSVPFAVGLFALGIPFIYFASQVKQYSSDIAAVLVLLLLALDVQTRGVHRARVVLLAVTGAIVVWISQTALFVIAGIALAFLVLYWRREGAARRWLLTGLAVWVVSAAAAAFEAHSNVTEPDREYFQAFWRVGFMPFPPASAEELWWLPEKLLWVFGAFATGLGLTNGGLNYRWSPVFTAVMVYGLWSLWRTRRDAALFLSLPVLVAIAASTAGVYPFTARLLAFLIPFFLLSVAAGARQLLIDLPQRLQFLSPLALAILGGAPVYAIATALPPSRIQHLRPGLEYLAENRQASDAIYVYSGAYLAFRYYAPRLMIPSDGVVYGTCAIYDPREYLRQLDSLRGKPRAWLVMTHEQFPGERELILGYLQQLGKELQTIDIPATSGGRMERASVHLFDLSAPAAEVNARTFTLPRRVDPSPAMLRWGCYGITGGESRTDPSQEP